MAKVIVIKTFASRIEAELAQGYLEANEIKSFVNSDDRGIGMGQNEHIASLSNAKLFVLEKDAKQAVELLKNKT